MIRGVGIARGERLPALVDVTPTRAAQPSFDFTTRLGYDPACRRHFDRGRRYLVLLQGQPHAWNIDGRIGMRTAIEVVANGDPWTAAVTAYVALSALGPVEQKLAIDILIAKGAVAGASKLDRAIAADLTRHRTTPSAFKSAGELEAIFDHGNDMEAWIALSLIGKAGDPAEHAFMKGVADRIATGKLPTERGVMSLLDGVVTYFEQDPDDAVLDELAALYLKANYPDRLYLSDLLLKRDDLRFQPTLERGLERAVASGLHGLMAADSEAAQLAAWFAIHPSPHALEMLQKRAHGNLSDLTSELVRALAMLGDEAVVRRALRAIARPVRPNDSVGNDARDEQLEVLAASPLDDADRALAAVIDANARSGGDVAALITGYGNAHHAGVDARLAQIAARPDLSPESRRVLDELVARRKAHAQP